MLDQYTHINLAKVNSQADLQVAFNNTDKFAIFMLYLHKGKVKLSANNSAKIKLYNGDEITAETELTQQGIHILTVNKSTKLTITASSPDTVVILSPIRIVNTKTADGTTNLLGINPKLSYQAIDEATSG
jgi:hypothetical protein